jgi:hypothetical protein
MDHNTPETFADLDAKTPYLDKAPNYERDYKTGKYVMYE